jgi:hypothetical protein
MNSIEHYPEEVKKIGELHENYAAEQASMIWQVDKLSKIASRSK